MSLKTLLQQLKSANYAGANQTFAAVMQEKVSARLKDEQRTAFAEGLAPTTQRKWMTDIEHALPAGAVQRPGQKISYRGLCHDCAKYVIQNTTNATVTTRIATAPFLCPMCHASVKP